jgi:hypothetical protein
LIDGQLLEILKAFDDESALTDWLVDAAVRSAASGDKNAARQIMRSACEQIRAEKRWIRAQRASLANECERVAALAVTMRKHGVRTMTRGDLTITVDL